MKADRAAVESRLHDYWGRVLDGTLADARSEKVDSETMAMFAETMAHVALARVAEQQGAAFTAAQLRMIAEKFSAAAAREQHERRH